MNYFYQFIIVIFWWTISIYLSINLLFLDTKGLRFIDGAASRGGIAKVLQRAGHAICSEGRHCGCIWPHSHLGSFSATVSLNPSTLNSVKPHSLKMWICQPPGNLNLALLRAWIICSLFCSLDMMTGPAWTLVTVPWGFPKVPAYVWSLDWR